MKTILAAGGKGTRIQSIADNIPKPLISIGGKPILQWEIECLVQQGYTDLIITVSYLAEKIMDYFGDGSKFGCHIEYFVEEQPLGNAGAVYKLWQKGVLEDDFILLIADAMFDIDFERFVRFHKEHDALATLFTHPNSHPYDSGVVIADESSHIVTSWFNKEDIKPKWYKNRVNAGLQILSPNIFKLLETNCYKEGGKVDLDRDILKPSVWTGKLYAYDSPEYVKDMGTPERYYQVSEDLRTGCAASRNLKNKQKAIFLDRDGTINKYVGFLDSIDKFELLPGTAGAISKINRAGYLAIVVTNQPVIARGEVTIEELTVIHNKMENLLGNEGAYLDAVYYCPHHPDKGYDGEVTELKFDCDCRKPKPGMLLQAAKEYNIDLSQSWIIGDSERDIQAGISAGCKAALICEDGSEKNELGQQITTNSLLEAVEKIFSSTIDFRSSPNKFQGGLYIG